MPLPDASSVLRDLANIGVSPVDVSSRDLEGVYGKLKRGPTAPNFDGIDRYLPLAARLSQEPTTQPFGLIVETRKHANLERTVVEFSRRLNMRVQLFHGAGNRDFVLGGRIGRLVESGQVLLTQLGNDRLDASRYNALFLLEDFWRHAIGSGKFLVFQTDAALCSRSGFRLDDFLNFDYIGSEWLPDRPIGLRVDGGNGGFSLRDFGRTIECLRRFDGKKWMGSEDTYFAFHMDLIGAKLGRPADCARFATQRWFRERSFGCHDITQLSTRDLARFLIFCPQARHTLPKGYLSLRTLRNRLKSAGREAK